MERRYGKWFIRLNWITLALIFLVVIAGSFVRVTGSGMGCPDWPKCFGSWVPPTHEAQLPENYREIYGEKRVQKVEKFARFLGSIGMQETAEKIRKDPATYEELPFNSGKTWTEYVNRLCGFLAGNGVLLVFILILWKYRTRRLFWLGLSNLLILSVQAWFGSIVVATNLVPWTITVHMLLALVIIMLQLGILYEVSPSQRQKIFLPASMRWIIALSFAITLVQMFLGTQVRESIDELTMQGFGRDSWTEKLGLPFYIHRSFSWLVLGMLILLLWLNYRGPKAKIVYTAFVLLAVELTSGVLLAYADMPGLVQISHLTFASILFGVLFMQMLRMRRERVLA